MSLTHWFCDGVLNRPAMQQSITNGVLIKSNTLRPFNHGQSNSIEGYAFVGSSVACLVGFASPSTIFWAIWAVIINAVKRKAVWLTPHICKKVFKGIKPAATDRNAPATIVFIVWIFWLITALLHAGPSCPFGAYHPFASHSMGSSVAVFCPVTATTNTAPRPDGLPINKPYFSAIAQAAPFATTDPFKDQPAAITKPFHIHKIAHVAEYNMEYI